MPKILNDPTGTPFADDDRLLACALGQIPADLEIRNCRVADVFNSTFFQASVLVKNGRIAGFGSNVFPQAENVFDADGATLVPGLINAHVHLESSLCRPEEFADAVAARGVTTLIADPHEICNVCGLDGLDYMLAATENAPCDIFFMLPSCVPATPFEHAGAILSAAELRSRIDRRRILGLGEVMNVPGVLSRTRDLSEKLALCRAAGKIADGHCPALSGSALAAYAAKGIRTDHECNEVEEMLEKIRCGLYVMIREGSASKNEILLLRGLSAGNLHRCLFCTDDRQAESLLDEGDLDNNVRVALRAGIALPDALRIASLNAAECYRLDDRGAIAPGRLSDFLLVRDPERDFRAETVFKRGEIVARDGVCLRKTKHFPPPASVSSRVGIPPLSAESFRLKLETPQARCLKVVEDRILTEEFIADVRCDGNGFWIPDPAQDLLLLTVIERHGGAGTHASCLLHNYGLKCGAVGTTIAHDSHNLVLVGNDSNDLLALADFLKKSGGGIALAKDGAVLDSLPLPVAGLMSDRPAAEIAAALARMRSRAVEELGANPRIDPFTVLSFLALPVIPKLRLTDSGLFDAENFRFVPPWVE